MEHSCSLPLTTSTEKELARRQPCSCRVGGRPSRPREILGEDHRDRFPTSVRLVLLTCAVAAAFAISGCGGASSNTPIQGSNTSVTVFATSTANDQLSEFNITVQSLTLTSSSGKTVTVFAAPQTAEFTHLNGHLEPLTTLTIPQDTYTSAAAVVKNAGFECITLSSSGGLIIAGFNYANTQAATVVNLPAPITVSGPAMGLSLDLLVSNSASWSRCDSSSPHTITPTFELTSEPASVAQWPIKTTELEGFVTSVDQTQSKLTVAAPDGGPTWTIASTGATVYQGGTGISALTPGMPVEMDAALQSDGSLTATRIAILDTDTTDLSYSSGPVETVAAAWPAIFADEIREQGYLSHVFGAAPFSMGNAIFKTSGQFTNLQNLPFTPIFNSSNIVAGQNALITTHATNLAPAPTYVPADTVTLIPQTINGTVDAISNLAGFTTYTISLAPYNLFPALAAQSGQFTVLTAPQSVVVYADSNTQMLNANPIAVGSVVRFYGLVFNDNGTLRMACAQINDGVTE